MARFPIRVTANRSDPSCHFMVCVCVWGGRHTASYPVPVAPYRKLPFPSLPHFDIHSGEALQTRKEHAGLGGCPFLSSHLISERCFASLEC